MGDAAPDTTDAKVVARADFGALIDALWSTGYTVIGPTVADATITYDEVRSEADLPQGWTDVHDAGAYSLQRRKDEALFGYVVGQATWKRYLYPPQSVLLHIGRSESGALTFSEPDLQPTQFAFLGVRGCEMAAIAIQDQVFLESGYRDRTYAERRTGLLTIAINCAVVGRNCFCVSMETGPECTTGYDIVVTEIIDGDGHRFLCHAGSPDGAEILGRVPGRPAVSDDFYRVAAIVAESSAHMGRSMDTNNIRDLLHDSFEHPEWDDVAGRCLACTNCTLVCPTCFCSTTEDTASLDGAEAVRSRRWDSCFTLDFSALHGSPVRASTKARYRQWMTHKLAGWYDQFGTSGCVGCGRCITWCPVGIDITAEAAAIREGAEIPA